MPRKKIDSWFKTEVDAAAAIDLARSSSSWKTLAGVIESLLDARLLRAGAARNGRGVVVIQNGDEADGVGVEGRYLVQPPLVARDAALLDSALKVRGLSAIVACREPKTSLGLCPIVALGSGVTVRIQVEEPKNPQKPTCEWFDRALHELGQHVLEQLDQTAVKQRQLDYLLAHLPAIQLHKPAYYAAIKLCNTLSCENV